MKTKIVFEDKDILVCYKPAGLAVQSGRASEPDMVSELKNYLAKGGKKVVSAYGAQGSVRCGLPSPKGPVYLGVIHRLDQPVSGLVVFAKNQRAAAALSRQVTDHVIKKTYRAVVLAENDVADDKVSHRLEDYMIKEPGGGSRIVQSGEKEAKKAILFYRCLAIKEDRALLEIDLKTGRHHQIRVQMAHAGMPLLGDARYGNEKSREVSARLGIRTVQLQAAGLLFRHPVSGKEVRFEVEDKLEL